MTSFRDAAMIERFVDTSGWAEWADQTLLFHARAATLFEEVWNKRGRLITTGFVLLSRSQKFFDKRSLIRAYAEPTGPKNPRF